MGVTSASANHLTITAMLLERATLRYTPAGVPVVDVLLEHRSEQLEAGQARQVTLQLKAIVFGAIAESLSLQPLGIDLDARGFLTNARNGKGVVFHIQDFKPI
ncbi:primosomal replication protein N [Tepidicella baoligensis]|uniref:primosomal replication protein N n=1 Tax=Tepidicella baoligensis TaxID=2707016 RepID=UPI0031B5EBA4